MAVIFSRLNSYQNRLFVADKHSSLGFVLAISFSLVFMIADHNRQACTSVRSFFSLFLSPLQYIVDYPTRKIELFSLLVSAKLKLIDENMQLRYQQTILEAQLQKLMVISNENSQLKALLSASSNAKMDAMAAHILAVDTASSRQLLVLNKGSRDGVLAGMPVLDAKGVMGQIIDVGLMTSTVLLISDSKSAVPVKNNRTGERAILIGNNSIDRLVLINLPRTSTIIKGDLLVTSGLGRSYPEGYPVGLVETITNSSGDDFIKVGVKPVALLNRNRLVLVLWPGSEQKIFTQQINERISIMDKAT